VCQSNACVQDLDMTLNAYVGADSPGGLAKATGRTCDGGTLDREVFFRLCTLSSNFAAASILFRHVHHSILIFYINPTTDEVICINSYSIYMTFLI
jgi:hypothetical protein